MNKRIVKIVSFLLATVFLLYAWIVYGQIHVSAATAVKYADENTVYNQKYKYNFRVTKDTKASPWGFTDNSSLHDKYDPNRVFDSCMKSLKDAEDDKGKFGMLYTNVGTYGSEEVDLKLTVMSWGQLADNYVTVNGNKITPYLAFRRDVIEVQSAAVRSVRIRFTFLKSGTSEQLTLSGHATLADLDGGQGFGFPEGCGISQAYVLKGNSHLKIEDNKIIATDDPHASGLNSSDKKGWSTVLFDENNFYLDFYGLYNKSMFEEPWTIGIHDNGTLASSVYEFTPYAIGNFEFKAPAKRVGSQGTSWAEAKSDQKATEESPYVIPGTLGTDKYDYIIRQEMSPNDLSSFVMQDTLENCLVYDSMKITNSDGASVTGRFTIKQSGQKITAAAKPEYLAKESFSNNEIYYFHITVHRDKTADMKNYKSHGNTDYAIPNKASVTITYGNGDKDTLSTKEVWVGYSRIPITEDSTDIEKKAGAVGSDWEAAGWHKEAEDAYRINEYEAFNYLVRIPLNVEGNELSEFRITDTLEECLDIDNTSKVRISDKEGNDVTGSFSVKIGEDGTGHKTVICQATAAALGDSSFWTDQVYTTRMTVHRKHTADIKTSMKEWLNKDGYTFRIPNQASVYIKDAGDKTVQKESNQSWVWDTVRSELRVEKSCTPYDGWEVGSEVEYAVKVSQIRQDGYAVDVEAWDYDLPEGLKLVPSSIKVTDNQISEGTPATVKPQGVNGWKAFCPRMQYQDYFVVSFRAKADESVNGRDTINTAYAEAANFTDEDDEKITVSDSAEVWVNTPQLEINKLADRYEHEEGDTVKYTVIVKNTKDYTVAKNVVVSDISLPTGMKLADGEDAVRVSFSPDTAKETTGWPVADGTVAIRKEEVENSVQVISNDRNTWTVNSAYLSSDANMTIEFTCLATEDVNGIETQNQAGVTADNVAKDKDGRPVVSMDDAKVYVNTADLTIEKTASHYEWQEGEDVEYQIVVSARDCREGTIARNVLIRDIEIPEGLFLESIEDVLVDGIPAIVTDKTEGPADIPNQLNEESYNFTRELDNTYTLLQEENGFSLNIPNLPWNEEVTITFPCKALQTAEGEDSWEWINKASVTADNQRGHETVEDDAEIYINTAQLTIDKAMSNAYYNRESEDYDNREPYEFRVGEEVEYRLTVNNIQKNSVARNVLIQDVTLPEGFTLADREDAVILEGYRDNWNNPVAGTPDTPNQLDPDHYKETETREFTFQMDTVEREDGSTGFTVSIDNLPCTTGDTLNPDWNTPLVITYRCTASEQANGYKIVNTASVKADNAEEKKDSEMIWINSPVLKAVKKADRKSYKLGDMITYEITAIQEQIGCLARNITFTDIVETEGVKLQKNSIVLMDETGKVINPDDYGIEIQNNSFTLTSRQNLICPDGNYPLSYLDANGEVIAGESYNPLNIIKQKKLTIEYQAAVVDDSLAGQTADNKIIVDSDEKLPDEDEAKVSVNGPVLNIDKVSDKEIYHIGETGIYKLTVTQLRDDVTAQKVCIRDGLQTEGARIVNDSLAIEFNGKEFKPEKLEVSERDFTIETGKNLGDADKLEIVYAVVFESPELDGKKVSNIAVAWGDNTPEEEQENVVLVKDLNPVLEIVKNSDRQEYEVGDTGHYTLEIRQKTGDAVARNVIIKDGLQMDGAQIITDTIQIANSYGTILEQPEIDATPQNYTIHTGADLAYGESFIVTYDVKFLEAAGGRDIINVARATADNARAEITNDVNTPVKVGDGLTALKTCDPVNGSVVKNGDLITYSITVTNTSGEDKKQILVKDYIPEFTEFAQIPGEQNNTTGLFMEIGGRPHAAFIIDNLAAGDSRTVQFQAKAVSAPEDAVIVNIAQVRETIAQKEDITEATWKSERFRSTNETVHFLDTQWALDTNKVSVGAPGLHVEKSSNQVSYNVGDTGVYTLTVSQTKKGAVSGNVVISDRIENDKAELIKNSIKIVDNEGKEIKGADINADDNSFTIETHSDLAWGETFTVTYEISFADKALEGTKVHNTAIVKDDATKEGEEPSDENEVEISKAVLAIEKTSDKYEYQTGETALYKLLVRQTEKNKTAKNVVIMDTLANQDVILDEGSIVIKDDEGQLVRKADVSASRIGFTIKTNSGLDYGRFFTVTYKVVMDKKTLVGHEVKNTAGTWADNAEKITADHAVIIKGAANNTEEQPPILNIDKTASKAEAKIGDTIHYTVTVSQSRENAVAEMVTIKDSFAGNVRSCISLDEDSIQLLAEGKNIKNAVIEKTGTGLEIRTGMDLPFGETIKLEYDVKAVKVSDSQVINTAIAGASNCQQAKAECAVAIPPVSTPTPAPTPSPTPTASPKPSSKSSGGNTISGGKTASAAKTGDTRPLKAVAAVSVIAAFGLAAGVVSYRRSVKNRRKRRRK